MALVQTRRAEGLPFRVASARKKETPGRSAGVGVFAFQYLRLMVSGSHPLQLRHWRNSPGRASQGTAQELYPLTIGVETLRVVQTAATIDAQRR